MKHIAHSRHGVNPARFHETSDERPVDRAFDRKAVNDVGLLSAHQPP